MNVKLSQIILAKVLRLFDKTKEKNYFKIKNKLFLAIKKSSKVLEIGPGTEVNFKYYPKNIDLTVIEPNHLFASDLRIKADKFKFKFKIIDEVSDKIPFADKSFDFVVSTLVLCSVKNLDKILMEINRVLKNNGKFIFIEHVIDEKNNFRRFFQKIAVYSPWKFFGEGCEPNKDLKKY